jgi:hypothetical protein
MPTCRVNVLAAEPVFLDLEELLVQVQNVRVFLPARKAQSFLGMPQYFVQLRRHRGSR